MNRILSFYLLLLLSLSFTHALEKVEITIDKKFIAYLDSNPYYDTSFYGTFSYNNEADYEQSQFSYRGAYSLNNLIKSRLPQRNWKFKTPKDKPYKGYKVWNYNYEPFLTHNLAYILMHDAGVPYILMHDAGVPCIPMEQVVLFVNGNRSGIYSEFPDPDNKKWLKKMFGDTSEAIVGDLYKAATDKPNLTEKYFSDLTVLGSSDSDYYLHYNKKTNDSTEQAAADYHSIRQFIRIINETADSQFEDTIDHYFEVYTFLKYLVVANYCNFWDGYPNRPKNYWLYHNPHTQKWTFIPWDLDATFDPVRKNFNNMGTECNYLFMYGQTDLNDYYTKWYSTSDFGESEITPRPLFTRIMNIKKNRDFYSSEYKRALSTYLKKETVLRKIDSLENVAKQEDLSEKDYGKLDTSAINTRKFVENRTVSLEKQLQTISAHIIPEDGVSIHTPCVITSRGNSLHLSNKNKVFLLCHLYLANGKLLGKIKISPYSTQVHEIQAAGIIIYQIRNQRNILISHGSILKTE